MAKDKDDVTPEVTTPTTTGTTRPGFRTEVTDAPDHDGSATPSQRVQEEQAAGRAALRDLGRTPAAAGYVDPADADHWRAAAVAKVINEEKQARDYENANPLPDGETSPGEVPSKGYTYVPPASEANEADKEKMEEVARVAEVQKARVKLAEQPRSLADNDKDNDQRDKEIKERAKEIEKEREQLAKNRELHDQQTKTKK
jgi:hypothetical protein